jgi:DNA-binding PadR family transcriptional regulator
MGYTRTAYVILGILAFEDHQSGYDIRKTIECSVGYFWGESYGQLYPTLKRLAAKALIVPTPPTPTTRAKRQQYSITAAGRQCLREWLAIPYRDDPPRDEFLLKLFFAQDAPPGVTIAHVRTFQQKHRQWLAELQNLEKLARERNSNQPGFPFWMLTLSYGLAQLRSALDWSESALAMLTAAGSPAPSPPPIPEDSIATHQSFAAIRQEPAANQPINRRRMR